MKNAEQERLEQSRIQVMAWKKWGPYLSERQWATVREDYSEFGNAWNYFTHDQARSRAYRWGEDGIAGISDDKQTLCFAVAFWNGVDPIIKERMFGLTNDEGNHGEDCKEYYFYLDNTPTHSYMRYLYKYPQKAYPYCDLVRTNRERGRNEPEYELIDTGVFDDDRYFDIFIEYAKADPEDILIQITVVNRGWATATLDVLPTLWFRNTWSWGTGSPKPMLRMMQMSADAIHASHHELEDIYLYVDGSPRFLFTENETNQERIFNKPNRSPYVKDGIDNCLVNGDLDAVNSKFYGTKAAAHFHSTIQGHGQVVFRARLTRRAFRFTADAFGPEFNSMFSKRIRQADEFYETVIPRALNEDERLVVRQALAGMLWSKQYYYFDLDYWLREHGYNPATPTRSEPVRNVQWFHMVNDHVIAIPDKWEYPWYASWNLAFQTVALAVVDLDFAKEQLDIILMNMYQHPSGQLPASEWNFSDVNPPVQAWAAAFLNTLEKMQRGTSDKAYLRRIFGQLLLNFVWWVNRKDRFGRNVFEGGHLGMDNIGVFDRKTPLPSGGYLEQVDTTAWMALFAQSMFSIAMELALEDPDYERMAIKFAEHFLWIAGSMDREGEHEDELWDDEDGFFYDLLCLPDGSAKRLKVRSINGLIPICAAAIIPAEFIRRFPDILEKLQDVLQRHPEIGVHLHPPDLPGVAGRHLLFVLDEKHLRRVLRRMLDEERFLSPYGIRSLSKCHEAEPFEFHVNNEQHRVAYEPAESRNGLFGGNSNFRGPVWFPFNLMIIRGLLSLYAYYGDAFKIECPTGSGNMMTLYEVAHEIGSRLTRIFLQDKKGRRPVFGGAEKFQTDPQWQNCLLFYEYFHGDNGAGIGASHQTGWSGLAALCMEFFARVSSSDILSDVWQERSRRPVRPVPDLETFEVRTAMRQRGERRK
jgi:Glycosyl hydrolase family 63 C-terminal domain